MCGTRKQGNRRPTSQKAIEAEVACQTMRKQNAWTTNMSSFRHVVGANDAWTCEHFLPGRKAPWAVKKIRWFLFMRVCPYSGPLASTTPPPAGTEFKGYGGHVTPTFRQGDTISFIPPIFSDKKQCSFTNFVVTLLLKSISYYKFVIDSLLLSPVEWSYSKRKQ